MSVITLLGKAAQARRLAGSIFNEAAAQELESYALELEAQADAAPARDRRQRIKRFLDRAGDRTAASTT